jgi:hypothetical protein
MLCCSTYLSLRYRYIDLTSPDSWARKRVARWHRVVDVDHQSGVGSLVSAWERDLWSRVTVTTAGHVDLAAAEVELRAASSGSRVKSNVLHAVEVLARGQALRDRG